MHQPQLVQDETSGQFNPRQETKLRKRTKTGCLTCRKRRIKCGEERPICGNCVKSKRHCEGYNQRVIFKPPIGDWPNHSIPANTLPYHNSMLPGSRARLSQTGQQQNQQQNYKVIVPVSAPVAYGNNNTKQLKSYGLRAQNLEPLSDLDRQFGYLSMRQRRQNQAESTLPTLSEDEGDEDSGYDSIGGDLWGLGSDVRTLYSNSACIPKFPPALSTYQGLLDSHHPRHTARLDDPKTARLFMHFIHNTGPSLSIFHPCRRRTSPAQIGVGTAPESFWTTIIPKLALRKQVLLHALLALSGLHLAQLQGVSRTPSFKHYCYSLRRLQRAISDPKKREHITTLATCLSLAVYEFLAAEYEKWGAHLTGAKQIILETDYERMIATKVGETPPAMGDAPPRGHTTGPVGIDTPSSSTLDNATVDLYMDLYWLFRKHDVYRSLVSGDSLLIGDEERLKCPPRATTSQADASYGTYDRLIALLGRIAQFGFQDRARKEEEIRANGGVWRPVSDHRKGLECDPCRHARKASPDWTTATAQSRGFLPGNNPFEGASSAPASSRKDQKFEKAIEQWLSVQQALQAFRAQLGPAFEPVPAYVCDPLETPFGSSLHYRGYDIASIWALFHMARIVHIRNHPYMPPAAMAAQGIASDLTKNDAGYIGRITAGITFSFMDTSKQTPFRPSLAGALMEGTIPLFVAAVQFMDPAQRSWVVDRLEGVSAVTGWHFADLVSDSCQAAWEKTAHQGRGPPWHRSPGCAQGMRDLTPLDLEPAASVKRQVPSPSTPGTRVHWASGLLSTVKNMMRSPLDPELLSSQNTFGPTDTGVDEPDIGMSTVQYNSFDGPVKLHDILSPAPPVVRESGGSLGSPGSPDVNMEDSPPVRIKQEEHQGSFTFLMGSATAIGLPELRSLSPAGRSPFNQLSSPIQASLCASDNQSTIGTDNMTNTDDGCMSPWPAEEKRKLVDRVMTFFWQIFRASPGYRSDEEMDGDSNSNANDKTGRSEKGKGKATDASCSQPHKRSFEDMGDGNSGAPGEDEDDDTSPKRSRAEPLSPDRKQRKFACPYFKRNQQKYQTWRSCVGPGWDLVRRMKEHLYRNHTLPIFCPRCYEKFTSETLLKDHQRADDPCKKQAEVLIEGFDKSQEKRLRCRKQRRPEPSEEEKWRETYRILFPDDDEALMPSPFYEYSTNRRASDGANSPGSGELALYEEFLRRELPPAVRRELEIAVEREFSPLEERLKSQLIGIVRDLQLQLFKSYTESRSGGVNIPSAGTAEDMSSPTATVEDLNSLENDIAAFAPAPASALEESFEFNPVLFEFSSLDGFADSTYGSLFPDSSKDPWEEGFGHYNFDCMDNGEGPSRR